jgi:hypothetical protein
MSGKGKGKEREYWQVPQPVRSLTVFVHLLMPVQWPPVSPFDTLAYPKPWPIEPFTRYYPKLQKYILYRDLPRILKVHDPWNLLRATPRMYRGKRRMNSGPRKPTLFSTTDSRPQPSIQLVGLRTMSLPRQMKQRERLFTIHSLLIRTLGTNSQVVLYIVKPSTSALVPLNHPFS